MIFILQTKGYNGFFKRDADATTMDLLGVIADMAVDIDGNAPAISRGNAH